MEYQRILSISATMRRAVRNGINPGSTVVSPSDRNLDHCETGSVRKKQNLRVKAPALDLLQGKHRSCGVSTECLEAALGVLEIEPENDSQQKIEDSSQDLPGERTDAWSEVRCASNVTQSPRRRRTQALPEAAAPLR